MNDLPHPSRPAQLFINTTTLYDQLFTLHLIQTLVKLAELNTYLVNCSSMPIFFALTLFQDYNELFVSLSGILDISPEEKRRRLEIQARENKWHQFVDGELILKQGQVDKRKGLFARRRMLLLTTGPRLFYVDPVNMVLKGEIPWSPELRVEAKNFRIFLVHTVN